jgi:DNA-binding XRE family transcriptional regulator
MSAVLQIPLTQGKYAIVDAADYDFLMQWKWCARKSKDKFYASRTALLANGKTKTINMHRVIMGEPEGMPIDHYDGDGLNNTRANLRICTNSQNRQNQQKPYQGKSSRFKGVRRNSKNQFWIAEIGLNKKRIYLGSFDSEIKAAEAYNLAARQYHGEFAYLNQIPDCSIIKEEEVAKMQNGTQEAAVFMQVAEARKRARTLKAANESHMTPSELKQWRLDQGLTQVEAAQHFGITETGYQKIERGERALRPYIEKLCAYAWRPMESAPLDGTWVLLFCPTLDMPVTMGSYGVFHSHSEESDWFLMEWDGMPSIATPTKWMSLPKPPSVSAKAGDQPEGE